MGKPLRKAQARLHARIMDWKATVDNTNGLHRGFQKDRAAAGGYRMPGSMK